MWACFYNIFQAFKPPPSRRNNLPLSIVSVFSEDVLVKMALFLTARTLKYSKAFLLLYYWGKCILPPAEEKKHFAACKLQQKRHFSKEKILLQKRGEIFEKEKNKYAFKKTVHKGRNIPQKNV